MHFVLRLELDEHGHPGNLPAQHAKVREWLGLASQAIGSSSNRRGELTIPVFASSSGVNDHVKVGSWKFEDENTQPRSGGIAP